MSLAKMVPDFVFMFVISQWQHVYTQQRGAKDGKPWETPQVTGGATEEEVSPMTTEKV